MARKIVNRKELREEAEAAEATTKKKKTPTKRKKRTKKTPAEIRMKLFWGVFNQSLKRVALYEFNQRKQATKKAADLSTSAKNPHFVQKVKVEITE